MHKYEALIRRCFGARNAGDHAALVYRGRGYHLRGDQRPEITP